MNNFIVLLLLLITSSLFSQTEEEIQFKISFLNKNPGVQDTEIKKNNSIREELLIKLYRIWLNNIGYPLSHQPNDSIYHHSGYSLSYNYEKHHANWTCHILSPELSHSFFYRTQEFYSDSLIKNERIDKEDYDSEIYDRGHLVPSADFHWSTRLINETYLYSNVAPQKQDLNRHSWKELEERLRDFVVNNHRPLYIVTGAFSPHRHTYLEKNNKIEIPQYFYKLAYDFNDSVQKAIAFILPNDDSNLSCFNYAISIDSLEKLTGITFLPQIKNLEIKKDVDVGRWMIEMQHHSPINNKNTLEKSDQVFLCGSVFKKNEKWFLEVQPYPLQKELQFKFFEPISVFQSERQPNVIQNVCIVGHSELKSKILTIESLTDIYYINKQ